MKKNYICKYNLNTFSAGLGLSCSSSGAPGWKPLSRDLNPTLSETSTLLNTCSPAVRDIKKKIFHQVLPWYILWVLKGECLGCEKSLKPEEEVGEGGGGGDAAVFISCLWTLLSPCTKGIHWQQTTCPCVCWRVCKCARVCKRGCFF